MAYEYPLPREFPALTPFQINNLRKLAEKLVTVPTKQFNMDYFFDGRDYQASQDPSLVQPKDYAPSCGTVACACGWGPAAGIPGKAGENWNDYAYRAFGASTRYTSNDRNAQALFNYLFDQEQGGTAKMAARRIQNVLRRL